MAKGGDRPGEFDLISRVLAPLSVSERGAFHLTDDAALLAPRKGSSFVVTADAIVEGVHFLKSDPPFKLAQKALRVNLSDLAAKGARPRAYLMTTAWPDWVTGAWIEEFARGLQHDQDEFGIALVGGDTVSTPGPLSISITAFGEVPGGKMIQRRGARAGDDVWVTGTIGDAGLGLKVALGQLADATVRQSDYVLGRYQVPVPRVSIAPAIARIAHASIDISDGLIADLGHVSVASRLGIVLNATDIPLSEAASALVRVGAARIEDLLAAGDDYEVAFTAPVAARQRVQALSRRSGVRITRIGTASGRTPGVTAKAENGEMLQISRAGFTHF
jgi:thiamine-monophosphate kinase